MKLYFFLILFLSAGLGLAETPRRVQKGVLDLRGVDLDHVVDARGDWEFHWQKFLDPHALPELSAQSEFMPVPGLWSATPANHPRFGYASYRLRVLADESSELTLHLPSSIWSSSRVFVDGKLIASSGQVGTSPETSVGGTVPKTYSFHPNKPSFEILVHVANYEIFLCGITSPIYIGSAEAILHKVKRAIAYDLFLIGALFIMGIYHLCLFALRREDRSTLCFGLMCLAVAAYTAVAQNGAYLIYFPELSFDNRLRIFNMTWMPALAAFCWFVYFICRPYFSLRVCQFVTLMNVAYGLLIFSTPARVFVALTVYANIVTAGLIIYAIICLILSIRRKLEGATLLLAGLAIAFIATLNDLLTTRLIISTPAMIGAGIFGFVFFQSYMIAMRFSKSFSRVKVSEKEIRSLSDALKEQRDAVIALNANLEVLVDEKTRDIRSIMENIPISVFMITQDFKIHKDHSRQLKEMYGAERIAASDAVELIFTDSVTSHDDQSQARSVLEASLGEQALSFQVNAHVLPSEIRQHKSADAERIFDLTWNAIENNRTEVEKILVTMRDVTEVRALQQRSRGQQEELEFIGEILSVPAHNFNRFIQSAQELIEENSKLLQSQSIDRRNYEILKLLFINMHTIKGAARSLYLKRMSEIFHDIEQYYAHLQKNPNAVWNMEKMALELSEAKRIVSLYQTIAETKLGRKPDRALMCEFSVNEIISQYRTLSQLIKSQSLSREVEACMTSLNKMFHARVFRQASDVFAEILGCLPLLAKDLNKDIPTVEADTAGILLTEQGEELLRKVFVHLLRNAMDHGIEKAEARLAKGKARTGKIFISFEKEAGWQRLVVSDDGQGLNLPKILEIGQRRGLIGPNDEKDPQKIAEIIFDSGLSTANHVSDISGRGVGMDAVRRFIEQYGGTIHLELQAEASSPIEMCPFSFIMRLPLALFEEPLDTRAKAA